MTDSDNPDGFGKSFGEPPSTTGTPFGQAPNVAPSAQGGPTGFGSGPSPAGFGAPSSGGGPGGPPGGPAPPGGGSMGHIPFDATESSTIRGLATLLTIAAALGIVSALAAGLNGMVTSFMAAGQTGSRELGGNLIGNFVVIIMTLTINGVLAFWMVKGAKSFRKVIDTDGADQALLIDALGQLRNIFWMKAILLMLGLFCMICVGLGMIMVLGSLL